MPKRSNPFSPVRRQNLAEIAVGKLRHAITTGAIAPNSPLAEPTLATQLGISRSPVREALIQLEREGLVRFDETGRTRVCSMKPEDFAEISSLRVSLESLGARWAVERWSEEDTEAIEENIERQERARSLQELSRLDVELHDRIMRTAQHARLLSAWLIIRPQFEMWLAHIHRVQSTNSLDSRRITVAAHRKLLKQMQSGSPDVAEKAMKLHVEAWAKWLPSAFKKNAASRGN